VQYAGVSLHELVRALSRWWALATSWLAAAPCACARELPPYGQALVVVDTDLAVPQIVDHLRIDIYGQDGTWLESRDVALPDPADWPASFGVYTPLSSGSVAQVRLRAYPSIAVREYLGERFTAAPTTGNLGTDVEEPDAAPDLAPRLVVDGGDVTPPTEPEPLTAVDRLVEVNLAYGSKATTVPVLLRGECTGTMTDMQGLTTCVGQEGQREAVTPSSWEEGDAGVSASGPSQQAAFGVTPPCTGSPRAATTGADGTPLFDDDACVPGGAMLLGLEDPTSIASIDGVNLATFPLRLVEIPSLFVDRYEVTVGRWRDRLAKGFTPPDTVTANDAPLPPNDLAGDIGAFCSWSSSPLSGANSRETMALTCVSYASARALCRFEGGDLLTEAEWEFAAGAAARPAKTGYPWGNGAPTCPGVVYGRLDNPLFGDNTCRLLGSAFGPAPVGTGTEDVTPLVGLHDMGGGVGEWVLDSARDYTSVCWMQRPILDPSCVDPSQSYNSVRGGSWTAGYESLEPSDRDLGDPALSADLGFRCRRSGSGS
jgi:formylglycine-generating enzyme required for sulfatase activity